MALEFAHVGDIGVAFNFTFTEKDGTTPVNLTGATTIEAKVSKPGDKAGKTWTLTATDAPNGKAQFITVAAGDLDVAGKWRAMGYAVDSGGADTHFTEDLFQIFPVLAGA